MKKAENSGMFLGF